MKLAIYDKSNNLRLSQTIESVAGWARERGVEYGLVEASAFPRLVDLGYSALYCPVNHDLAYLSDLQRGVKLIVDHDIVDPKVAFKNDAVLSQRPYAFRRAFGGAVDYQPELQVPYVHLPDLPEGWERGLEERDTLIFDLHRWLPVEAQLSFLALMQEVGRHHSKHSQALKRRLKIYLTGLIHPEPYRAATEAFLFLNEGYHCPDAFTAPFRTQERQDASWADVFGAALGGRSIGEGFSLGGDYRNPMDIVMKNHVPPLVSREEFMSLFSRAVAFVTDHGDPADQDITTCLAMGVPIVTVPRSPWRASSGVCSTVWAAHKLLSPRFHVYFEHARRSQPVQGRGLSALWECPRVDPIPESCFRDLYFASWDRLWEWVLSGRRDPELSELINGAARWEFGMA